MAGIAGALDRRILAFMTSPRPDEGRFESLALEIFAYQFERNLPYREFCRAAGADLSNVKSWRGIPAMPSAGFKELVLSSFPAKKAARFFRTSGTTRQMRGVHFFETLKLYDAAILQPFRRHLLPDDPKGLSYFFLMPPPDDARDSSLSYMMGVVDRKLAGGKGRFYVRGGRPDFEKLGKDLAAVKGKAFVLATAFALKAFLDHLADKKITLALAAGSRLMETGGFKGRVKEVSKDSLYAEVEDRLGIPAGYCVSEYGMTELSSQCYDTTLSDKIRRIRRKPIKMGPHWMKTLVIDPRTGRPAKRGAEGILRHVDLANRGSVIAVQTEDWGREETDGFTLLGRAPTAAVRGCSTVYEEFLRG